jgi:predicted nicotinamide N-methyase
VTPSRQALTTAEISTFITANTALVSPPLVPEIKLHLATEIVPIWQMTEDQFGLINVPPPFWAFAWAGGQALGRYVLDNPGLVAGKAVLDLGTGSGLQGIAAMKAGAASVLAADIDLFACAAATLNARVNGVAFETTTDNLLLITPSRQFDVLLVGDLFYEKPLAETVCAFIDQAVGRGALTLIGDPSRTYFPRDRFTLVGSYDVPVSRELEDTEIKVTTVWRI